MDIVMGWGDVMKLTILCLLPLLVLHVYVKVKIGPKVLKKI